MAIDATDWEIDRQTGNIRYTGDAHGGASPTYATVIDFHRWIAGLADDASSQSSDDEHDITDSTASERSTDNIITLKGSYNIDDTASQHLYDGSIIQGTGGTEVIYDGIVNFGNSNVQIQLIQNGAVLAGDWWNQGGAGLNADATQGISHRFMIKVRDAGSDIDGRKLIGTTRTFGNTYGEFKINGTARGNNVLALSDASDLNNETLEATVGAYTDVYLDRSTSTATVSGVNSTGQAVLNVSDGAQFTAGDFISYGTFIEEYQIVSISVNALTLNRNLADATTGGEAIYDINIGFTQIDVDNDTTNEDYYAHWDRGGKTINQFYERLKWLSRDGSTQYLYGIPAELFRGITHEITVDTATGTFAAVEDVSWTGGTGQMLAINSPTAATKMWIQILTGTAPGDGDTITGGVTSATVDVNVTVTDRESLIKTPFVGASTGSALIGSYGLTLQTGDLSAADKVFDLGNAQVTPPNNVTFSVNGVTTEDYIIVTANAAGDIDKDQLSLNTTLSGASEGSVVVTTAIPTDTRSSGTIRVVNDEGINRKLSYDSYSGSTFTLSANQDFSGAGELDSATAGNDVYITYIDKQSTTDPEEFTVVYNADRTLFVRVRDGGGTPIKPAETTGVLGSGGGSATINRISDA